MTLRARLLSGLGALVLLAVASSGWLALKVVRRQLVAAQEDDARAGGRRLLHQLEASCGTNALDAPETRQKLRATIDEWRARGLVRDATIVKNGVALVGTMRPGDELGVVADVVVRREGEALRLFGSVSGVPGDRAAVRIELPGEESVERALGSATTLMIVSALFCTAVVLVFGAVFVERIAASIGTLAGAARRVASGDLDGPAVGRPGGDELSRLAIDFDGMTAALRRERATVAAQLDTLVAQEKLATVGRLAAGVAHEIGNPLAAIIGFSDMLYTDENEQLPERRISPPDRKDALARVRGEAARIQTIIRELLDYSRPVKEASVPIETSELVERALALLRPQPRFRDIEIERDLGASRVDTVASRVEQILVNVLLNAADAMGGRGRIVIRAVERDALVAIAIEDDGPGIPVADRDKIFDPFFTTKDPGEGTGLGLSISQALAQALGGELRLDPSQPTRGARFVLTLPRDRSADRDAHTS